MPTSRHLRSLLAAACLVGAGQASALTIEFDYSYDDGATRLTDGQKLVLSSIAAEFGARLTDTLDAATYRSVSFYDPGVAPVSVTNVVTERNLSVAADTIVAQPTTITGSIGVIGGKLIIKGLYGKLGVNSVVLTRGKNANIFGANRGFNRDERASFRHFIEQTYADFLTKVAKGRKLPLDTVRKLAQGRIWSGKQAFKQNLVDHLGGLEYAVRLARLKAKLPESAPIVSYPKPKSIFEYLRESADQEMRLGLRQLVPTLARALPGLPLELLRSAIGIVDLLRHSQTMMHIGVQLRIR